MTVENDAVCIHGLAALAVLGDETHKRKTLCCCDTEPIFVSSGEEKNLLIVDPEFLPNLKTAFMSNG